MVSGMCCLLQGFLRARGQGAVPPACGAADQQADCVARLGPLVAVYAGQFGEEWCTG